MIPAEAGRRATLYHTDDFESAVYKGVLKPHPEGMFFAVDGWNGAGYFLPGRCERLWRDTGDVVMF